MLFFNHKFCFNIAKLTCAQFSEVFETTNTTLVLYITVANKKN